jgi:hypothetical protein
MIRTFRIFTRLSFSQPTLNLSTRQRKREVKDKIHKPLGPRSQGVRRHSGMLCIGLMRFSRVPSIRVLFILKDCVRQLTQIFCRFVSLPPVPGQLELYQHLKARAELEEEWSGAGLSTHPSSRGCRASESACEARCACTDIRAAVSLRECLFVMTFH